MNFRIPDYVILLVAIFLSLLIVATNMYFSPDMEITTVTYTFPELSSQSEAAPSTASKSADGAVLVHINHADLEELCKIPSIGEVTAQNILDYIGFYGAITDLQELKLIKGIGNITFEKIKDYIIID